MDRLEKKEHKRSTDPDYEASSNGSPGVRGRSVSPGNSSPLTVVTVAPGRSGSAEVSARNDAAAAPSYPPPPTPPTAAVPAILPIQPKISDVGNRLPYGGSESSQPPYERSHLHSRVLERNPIAVNSITAVPVTPQRYQSVGSHNGNTEGRSDALMTMSSPNVKSEMKKSDPMDTITVVPLAPPRPSSPINSERSRDRERSRAPSEPSASVVAKDEENDIIDKSDILREYIFREGTTGKSIRVLGLTEGRGMYYINGSPRKMFTVVVCTYLLTTLLSYVCVCIVFNIIKQDYNGEVIRFPELQRSIILPLEFNMKEEVVRELKSLFDFCYVENNLKNGNKSLDNSSRLHRISTPAGSPPTIRTPAGGNPPQPPAPIIPAIVNHSNGSMWEPSRSPRLSPGHHKGPYRLDPFSAGINTLVGVQDPDLASTPPRSRSVSPGDMGPGYHYNY